MARDPHPFLVPPECFAPDGQVHFPSEEAHHATHVVRLGAGDECRVVDGRGGLFRVILAEVGGELVGRVVGGSVVALETPTLTLGFPVLRQHARADWLIEKAVEVGVDRLRPVGWERSLKRSSPEQMRRWGRIAREAMKQSERRWLPEIEPELPSSDLPRHGRLVLADPEGADDPSDLADADSVLLLVGPEGGLKDEERDRMIERGAMLWSLGPARLRAETAAIVASHRLGCILRALRKSRRRAEGGD